MAKVALKAVINLVFNQKIGVFLFAGSIACQEYGVGENHLQERKRESKFVTARLVIKNSHAGFDVFKSAVAHPRTADLYQPSAVFLQSNP